MEPEQALRKIKAKESTMKERAITPLASACLMICMLISTTSLAKKKTNKNKKRLRISLSASLEGKASENLDNLSDVEVFDRQGQTSEIQAKLSVKTKISKVRLKSKTSFNYMTLINDLYDDLEVINSDNIETGMRKTQVSQQLSASYKLSKDFSFSTSLDYEKKDGYFVVTQLQILPDGSISKDIKYNILDARSTKVGGSLSGKLKINKKLNLVGIYKFSEYSNTGQYSFIESQGTNDRRINSAGALARLKIQKNLSLYANVQRTHTEYKSRLTTLENGAFNLAGVVDRATFFDSKYVTGIKYTIFNLEIIQSDRDDKNGGGNGYNSLGIDLGINYNIKKFSFKTNIKSMIREFTTQVGTGETSKRIDEIFSLKAKAAYKINKRFKVSINYLNSKSESNNIFGQNENETLALKLTGSF